MQKKELKRRDGEYTFSLVETTVSDLCKKA